MSKFYLHDMNNKKLVVNRTMNHEPIFQNTGPSMLQQVTSDTTFVPNENVKPGQKTLCDVKYSSRDIREEKHPGIIKFTVSTADGTNHGTYLYDALSFVDFLEFEINGGKDKLTFSGRDEMQQFYSDWIKEHTGYDQPVGQFLAKYRHELNTFAGIEVDDTADVTFYLPLEPFLPFLSNVVVNGLMEEMRVSVRFVAIPVNAQDGTRICKSNTTSAAYNSSVTFNNITFFREYDIIRDVRRILRPDLSTVLIPIPQYERKVFTQAWDTLNGNKIEFKLSEIAKRKDIQHLDVFIRKNETAFNATDAQKKYSGYQYIQFKVRELFGERNELNYSHESDDHTRRLRSYEIESHKKRYGRYAQDDIYDQTLSDLGKFYTHNTTIYFDTPLIESGHNEVINTLDSDVQDYVITLYCNGSVGADCDVIVLVNYYEKYRWGAGNRLIKQL